MALQRFTYTDEKGRKKYVLLPEGASEDEVTMGVPVGPPSLEDLNLPEEIEVRLNNELYHRNIVTLADALKNRAGIVSALQATFKVDAGSIVNVFLGKDYQIASPERPRSEVPLPVVPERTQPPKKRRR